ncbi:glycoprotein-N-acetylgalactosamine 3-beta-galactosyltransferase 1-like [Musca vetustissima]|uniref:glycoprotein-N-acetylgalactosamine 3-beta-galactosyltransferase 1-like n=1 Tax=Musca vetustissima TaxID=27455 RepID=UPI002AB79B88|nr:glycoprotein-N-acetylgalactosamine 3-beta-galactosyltransferase 1-like [Musca vetustissima]
MTVQEFMASGAGYVLSKNALMKFINEAYDNSEICNELEADENMALSNCLRNINVTFGDTRDEKHMERFIAVSPSHVIPDFKMDWYGTEIYHSVNENVSCCSPHAISFHYINWRELYTLDYLLYTLKPFGLFSNITWTLPKRYTSEDHKAHAEMNEVLTT